MSSPRWSCSSNQFLVTRDPMLLTLAAAPWDNEPVTKEEEAAVREAEEDIAAGRVYSDAEVWQRLGHKPREASPLKHRVGAGTGTESEP